MPTHRPGHLVAFLSLVPLAAPLAGAQEQTPGPARREIAVVGRYLHLPVKDGATPRHMTIRHGAETVDEFDIELADTGPDFHVFVDVSRYLGQTLRIDVVPESRGLASIVISDELPGAEAIYQEALRPQVHFSSRRGWNNDPNGLVYHAGEYHLFYQHNPYGRRWGNMHWGHAVSTDLVHWRELPIALYPFRYGDWCFSGSAVVDAADTAGFRTGNQDVIVAAYTSTGRGECIAYSTDRGRTFTDFAGNPVVEHRGRDPKVIWYEPGQHWVMAVYDERNGSRGIAFYTSDDLKTWAFQSRIDGYYECPEIFELAVDGDASHTKWVVYAADGNYSLGRFDGKTFTPESGKHRGNWGNCFYASQTYNGIPAEDGRRIQIGWARIDMPGMPFNQMMTFPVELSLRTTEEGPRLFASPVREIATLHARHHPVRAIEGLLGSQSLLEGDLHHLRATFRLTESVGEGHAFGFRIRGVPVRYDVVARELSCAGSKAPLQPVDGRVSLEILVDRTSIEIFANAGRRYLPVGIIFAEDDHTLEIFSVGAPTTVESLDDWTLHSACHVLQDGDELRPFVPVSDG